MGLQNPGVDAFIEEELPWLIQQGATVIANVSGNSVDEYAELAETLDSTAVSYTHLVE